MKNVPIESIAAKIGSLRYAPFSKDSFSVLSLAFRILLLKRFGLRHGFTEEELLEELEVNVADEHLRKRIVHLIDRLIDEREIGKSEYLAVLDEAIQVSSLLCGKEPPKKKGFFKGISINLSKKQEDILSGAKDFSESSGKKISDLASSIRKYGAKGISNAKESISKNSRRVSKGSSLLASNMLKSIKTGSSKTKNAISKIRLSLKRDQKQIPKIEKKPKTKNIPVDDIPVPRKKHGFFSNLFKGTTPVTEIDLDIKSRKKDHRKKLTPPVPKVEPKAPRKSLIKTIIRKFTSKPRAELEVNVKPRKDLDKIVERPSKVLVATKKNITELEVPKKRIHLLKNFIRRITGSRHEEQHPVNTKKVPAIDKIQSKPVLKRNDGIKSRKSMFGHTKENLKRLFTTTKAPTKVVAKIETPKRITNEQKPFLIHKPQAKESMFGNFAKKVDSFWQARSSKVDVAVPAKSKEKPALIPGREPKRSWFHGYISSFGSNAKKVFLVSKSSNKTLVPNVKEHLAVKEREKPIIKKEILETKVPSKKETNHGFKFSIGNIFKGNNKRNLHQSKPLNDPIQERLEFLRKKISKTRKISDSIDFEFHSKPSPELEGVFSLMNQSRVAFGSNQIELAKKIYIKARERYIELDYHEKKEVYNELFSLYSQITRPTQMNAAIEVR